MALLIHCWDMPPDRRGQEEYRLIGQELVPIVARQPGVREFRAYRSPAGATPQVMVQVEFDSDDSLHQFVASHTHGEMLRDLLRVGCHNLTTQVWAVSPAVPHPIRGEDGPG